MVYPYNGELCGLKREWSTDIFSNVDRFWKHIKWKQATKTTNSIVPLEIPTKGYYAETEINFG
jgi:hypothetical protein